MITDNKIFARWKCRWSKHPTNISILQISNRSGVSTTIVMESLIRTLEEQLDTYKQANSDLAITNNILQQTINAHNIKNVPDTYDYHNNTVHYNPHNDGDKS